MIWNLFSSVRRWFLIKVLRRSPYYVDLLDFFSNPVQPWNKKTDNKKIQTD